MQLASWGRRLAALLVDGLILGGVVLFTLLAAGMSLEEVNDTAWNGSSMAVIALFVLPEAIYDTAMVGARNQTFGKMALGIAVVDASGHGRIGYRRAFRRWLSTTFLWALFWIPGIVDHLWPLRDGRRQALHDKLAGSVVVRT